MAQTFKIVVFALLAGVLQVDSGLIGPCDDDLVASIMTANSQNCPANLLQTVYKESPTVVFRVFPKGLAERAKCVIGVLQEPQDNVFDFVITAHFKNESWSALTTTFVMVESRCGLMFKHIVEENYSTFLMAISYFDGITLGYYGCSDNAKGQVDEFTYVVCLSVTNVDEELTAASVQQCKQHMAAMTNSTDLTDMDVNDCAEYLE